MSEPRHARLPPPPLVLRTRTAPSVAGAGIASARRVRGGARAGLLAGLSDDDPAGITTYSIMGADYGYRLLWVLALSTIALIVFHEVAVRTGV